MHASAHARSFFLSVLHCVAQCMGEIANLKFDDHPKVGEYTQKFQQAFVSLMERCVCLCIKLFILFASACNVLPLVFFFVVVASNIPTLYSSCSFIPKSSSSSSPSSLVLSFIV